MQNRAKLRVHHLARILMYFFKTFRRGGGNLRASTRQNGQYEGGKGPTLLRIPRELRCTAIAVSDYFGDPEHLVTHHAPPCKMEYPQSEKWATAQSEKWATAKNRANSHSPSSITAGSLSGTRPSPSASDRVCTTHRVPYFPPTPGPCSILPARTPWSRTPAAVLTRSRATRHRRQKREVTQSWWDVTGSYQSSKLCSYPRRGACPRII